MTRIARIVAVASLWPVLALTTLAGSAAAQKQLLEVENGQATKVLQVADDGGFVVKGSFDAGTIPATGGGVRLMWYPGKAALRAGLVAAAEWDDANIGPGSIALGVNTIANGGNSTALGTQTMASGGNSTALGAQTIANGGNSTAMGVGTTASGPGSTALGRGTTASGFNSTATGNASLASGESSTALGNQTTASAFGSTATGNGTTASGHSATAMGIGSVASGGYSTAMGDNAKSIGQVAVAMGRGTAASGDFSTAMGDQTTASGIGSTAMGVNTSALGFGSVAMGSHASAAGAGSFVFADRSSTQAATASDNQFLVRAHGGIGFNSGTNIGCDLPAGVGAWACTSSRLAKEGFEDMNGEAVLAKLARIPIQRWSYLGTRAAHVGPFAEDFWAAFGLGEGSTTITTVDADGIALLGVQTLERRTAELRAENVELRVANDELRTGHADILRRLEALEADRRRPR